MIKYFRQLRHNLLSTHRIGKYLLYAIGEIILVVIGILIALKLSNLNTVRAERDKERILLSEMRQNMAMDLTDLQSNIKRNWEIIHSNRMVLRHLNGLAVNEDSVSVFYANIKGTTVQIKNTSAYDNLKSIGFDLISNDSLRRQITRLYSEKYEYLYHVEVIFDQAFQMNHIYPQVNAKIVQSESERYAHPLDPASLSKDNLFKETLQQNIGAKEFIVGYQEDLRDFMIQLMQSIAKQMK